MITDSIPVHCSNVGVDIIIFNRIMLKNLAICLRNGAVRNGAVLGPNWREVVDDKRPIYQED